MSAVWAAASWGLDAALGPTMAHRVVTPFPVRPVLTSPLPVDVRHLPQPDELASKTLEVATRTLQVSVVAIFVGVVAIGVAIFDAINNRRQLVLLLQEKAREPNLVVDISRLSDVVQGSDKDGAYYDLKVTFGVANLDGPTTSAADNVTVRLGFPEAITSTQEWEEQKERGEASELASALTGFASWRAVRPLVRNLRKLVTTERLSERTPSDGYREVPFFDENGLQLVPGTRTSISETLALHVPDNAGSIEWEALSVQGRFPRTGRGRIDLVAAAKEEIAARDSTTDSK
jgi:hypothetical protein